MEKQQVAGHGSQCSCKKKHFFLGLFFTLIGIWALYSTVFTTMLTVELLGVILACSCFGSLVRSLLCKTWPKRFSALVMAVFSGVLAYSCLVMPVQSLLAFTPVFALFFFVLGAIRMVTAGFVQYPHWEWSMLTGIVTSVLGLLILLGWPASAFWVLGVFVGIDLLMIGLGMLFVSVTCEG